MADDPSLAGRLDEGGEREVVLRMDSTEARVLWHAASTTVELMDAVASEPGNSIPPHAPLYGQRERLLGLARCLDHETNQAGGPGPDDVLRLPDERSPDG